MTYPIRELTLEITDTIPEDKDLKPDVFYYSPKYHTTTHLCPCGCGHKVVMPIEHPGQVPGGHYWHLHLNSDKQIDIRPSVGNWDSPCRSHYWIRANKVDPC